MKTKLKLDEKIIIQTQPHWFTLIVPFIVALVPLVVGIAIGGPAIFIGAAFIFYYIYKMVERKNNLWIVTNLRVIDEYGVFTNNTKESPLDKINNVSYTQSFWGKVFGYGNVQIQTAAEVGSTIYYSVENPRLLKDTITQMQEEYKHFQIKRQATELANAIVAGQKISKVDVAEELEKLFELKQKGILTEDEYSNRKAKILNS